MDKKQQASPDPPLTISDAGGVPTPALIPRVVLDEKAALNAILEELRLMHKTLDRVGQVMHDTNRTLMLLGAQAGLIDVETTEDGRVNVSPKGRGKAKPKLYVPQ